MILPHLLRLRLPAALLVLVSGLAAAQPAAPAPDLASHASPVPAARTASALPPDWRHGAFAEIYVRGYRDSDGDGIGDLRGLIQSLDYLQALGVRGLWLMPVTASGDGDHGYAVRDFRDIEPAYGTLADFDELLRQAHARGIGVIVDYVINHASDQHPLFQASRRPSSPYRDWFVWREEAPTGWEIFERNPWEAAGASGHYLAQFSRHMPEFNMQSEQVVAFHEDNLRFWLNRGVDGFRFDAVPHLVEHGPQAWYDQPEDHVLMGRFRAVVDAYPNRYVVCEATGNERRYGSPQVCGGAFAIWQAPVMIRAARGDPKAVRAVADYYLGTPAYMAMMLSNHDGFAGRRLWDQVGGDIAQYRLAAATYLLQPGTPFIYYGEEIGMAGAPGLSGDPELRIPMSWSADATTAGFTTGTPFRPAASNVATQNVAAEQARPDGILAWYRALLALRNRSPALLRGDYAAPTVQGKAIAFQRRDGGEHALVLVNYGLAPRTLRLRKLAAGQWQPAFPDATGDGLEVGADGRAEISLPAQSVRVLLRSAQGP
jgi:alpha-amylase